MDRQKDGQKDGWKVGHKNGQKDGQEDRQTLFYRTLWPRPRFHPISFQKNF